MEVELLISILLSYIMYNVAIGLVLAIVYYTKEKEIRNKEFWLLLFPVIGLGSWIHKRHIRQGAEPQYPAKWYVYKYMMWLHGIYIPLFIYICYCFINQPQTQLSTYATEATGNAGGGQLVGLGLILDGIANAAKALHHFIVLLIKLGIAAFISLGFVILPLHAMGNIEAAYHYKKHGSPFKQKPFKQFRL